MNAHAEKRRFPIKAVLTVGIPALCLVACGALAWYYWVEVRPLYAWPEEPMERIEAKWLLVEELAEIFAGSEDSAKGRSRILTGMGLSYSGAIIGMSKDIEKYDACVASVRAASNVGLATP